MATHPSKKCDITCRGCDYTRINPKFKPTFGEEPCGKLCPAGKPCMRQKGHKGHEHESYAWCGDASARWKD